MTAARITLTLVPLAFCLAASAWLMTARWRRARAYRRRQHAARLAAAREQYAERTVIYRCGCTLVYFARGECRFASCPPHRRHPDWQLWEAQIAEAHR